MNGTSSYIREKITDAATQAAQDNNSQPQPAREALLQLQSSKTYSLPLLGEYVPQGWKKAEEWFVKLTDSANNPSAWTPYEVQRSLELFERDGVIDKKALGLIEAWNGLGFVAVFHKLPTLDDVIDNNEDLEGRGGI